MRSKLKYIFIFVVIICLLNFFLYFKDKKDVQNQKEKDLNKVKVFEKEEKKQEKLDIFKNLYFEKVVTDIYDEIEKEKSKEFQTLQILHETYFKKSKDYPLPMMIDYNLYDENDRMRFCKSGCCTEYPYPGRGYHKESPYGHIIKWLFCHKDYPKYGISDYQPCAKNAFILKILNSYVDSSGAERFPIIPGMVFQFDHINKRQFAFQPFHLRKIKYQKRLRLIKFDKLINFLGSPYPSGFGHFSVEILPTLCYLLEYGPKNIPILAYVSPFTKQFYDRLEENGYLNQSLLVNIEPDAVYYARELYIQQVYPHCQDDANKHFTSEMLLLLKKMLLREEDILPIEKRDVILVINRADARNRRIKSHDQLLVDLRREFPQYKVRDFLGSRDIKGNLTNVINIFKRARIVIAPHGAGLSNLIFVGEGSSVIEIGYNAGKNPLPSSFYALSVALGLKYNLELADGQLFSDLTLKSHKNIIELVRRNLHNKIYQNL